MAILAPWAANSSWRVLCIIGWLASLLGAISTPSPSWDILKCLRHYPLSPGGQSHSRLRTTGIDLLCKIKVESAVPSEEAVCRGKETSLGLDIPVQFETFYHVHLLHFPKRGFCV